MLTVEKSAARNAVPQRLDDLAWRIEAEFREMPGMRLSFVQVKRLWNLSNASGCWTFSRPWACWPRTRTSASTSPTIIRRSS